jgi:hypothetical protein
MEGRWNLLLKVISTFSILVRLVEGKQSWESKIALIRGWDHIITHFSIKYA